MKVYAIGSYNAWTQQLYSEWSDAWTKFQRLVAISREHRFACEVIVSDKGFRWEIVDTNYDGRGQRKLLYWLYTNTIGE